MKKIVLLFAGAAISLLAQPPQGPPPPRGFFAWWDSPIAQDLNLKEEQNQQIRDVVRSYRNKLIDQRSAADKAEGELEDVFNEEKLDQKKANDAIDRLANARSEMSRTMSQMSVKLRMILTVQQWRELQRRMPKGPPPGAPAPGRPGAPRGENQPPPGPRGERAE